MSDTEAAPSFKAARARTELIAEMTAGAKTHGFVDPRGVHNGRQAILKDIHPLRDLFQPREEFEGHIKDLQAALKMHGGLDPILVGWTGKRVVLIEGHHRHEAYMRSGYKLKPVAVEWFTGSIHEAISASVGANSKHKLPMTLQQRLNAAWRLVRLDEFSKAEIARNASVSDGQIGKMRRVLKKHYEEVIEVEAWAQAWQIASGRGEQRTDDEHEV
jgi:ParB-like nuclease domain